MIGQQRYSKRSDSARGRKDKEKLMKKSCTQSETSGQREEDIDERVIENEIVHNIRNFIMTFGKGFSFIGSQVHFDKLGHDHWVDLLFFNRYYERRRTNLFPIRFPLLISMMAKMPKAMATVALRAAKPV